MSSFNETSWNLSLRGCLLENDDAFLEGLKSDDCCSIFVNYFKNIQEKIEDFYIMVRKNNKKEIKCENHL